MCQRQQRLTAKLCLSSYHATVHTNSSFVCATTANSQDWQQQLQHPGGEQGAKNRGVVEAEGSGLEGQSAHAKQLRRNPVACG